MNIYTHEDGTKYNMKRHIPKQKSKIIIQKELTETTSLPNSCAPNLINLNIIFGEAGTGKTYELAKSIINCPSKYFVVLTATHSALNTIYDRVCEISGIKFDRQRFKTIYSYFRINYVTNNIQGQTFTVTHMFFDEFSLINSDLFKKCLKIIKRPNINNGNVEIYISGDVMQLNSIPPKGYGKISVRKIRRWSNIDKKLRPGVILHLAFSIFGLKLITDKKNQHVRTVFNNLIGNKRSQDGIVQKILNNIYGDNSDAKRMPTLSTDAKRMPTLSSDAERMPTLSTDAKRMPTDTTVFNILETPDVINMLYTKKDSILLSSKYSTLQYIHDAEFTRYHDPKTFITINTSESKHSSQSYVPKYSKLHLYKSMHIVSNITSKSSNCYNGEDLYFAGLFCDSVVALKDISLMSKIEYSNALRPDTLCLTSHHINSEYDLSFYIEQESLSKISNDMICIIPISELNIYPGNVISYHKSQGKGINHVILCIDDLFDMAMLYTGITRTRQSCYFYSRIAYDESTNAEEYNEKVLKLIYESSHKKDFNALRSMVNKISRLE